MADLRLGTPRGLTAAGLRARRDPNPRPVHELQLALGETLLASLPDDIHDVPPTVAIPFRGLEPPLKSLRVSFIVRHRNLREEKPPGGQPVIDDVSTGRQEQNGAKSRDEAPDHPKTG